MSTPDNSVDDDLRRITSGLEFCPRCGSGPRQAQDVDECPDCGYRWSGPPLRLVAPAWPDDRPQVDPGDLVPDRRGCAWAMAAMAIAWLVGVGLVWWWL